MNLVDKKICNDPTISKVFREFNDLNKALVDASSLIYMSKAGFLHLLAQTIKLSSLPEILAEVGKEKDINFKNIVVLESCKEKISNDRKLIVSAKEYHMSVISEDREVLLEAKKEGLSYFNAAMMLNFLFFRKKINEQKYSFYYQHLKQMAWYNQAVMDFVDRVFTAINQTMSFC